MSKVIAVFFTIIFVSIGLAIGYYYFQEIAPVCSIVHAEQFQTNQTCECQGLELERSNSLDSGGLRRTVCIGQVKSIACSVIIRGEVFEDDCLQD